MNRDSSGNHQPLAHPSSAGETAPPRGSDSLGCGSEHGRRGGTRPDGANPRDTRPDHATRYVEIARGILSYSELAPLLAERVALEAADQLDWRPLISVWEQRLVQASSS